jgi:putative Mg2+ transporter-C (MgtC) family protein
MDSQLSFVFHQGDGIVLVRLVLAALAGAVIGWNRFRAGKSAGVGTHALVALGSALFVLVPLQMAGAQYQQPFTRVIQGIATGVGFLGAGEIFRESSRSPRIHGLTSAAAIWVTASLGVLAACGSGFLVAAATVLIMLVFVISRRLEARYSAKLGEEPQERA